MNRFLMVVALTILTSGALQSQRRSGSVGIPLATQGGLLHKAATIPDSTCEGGPDTDALLDEVREWIARQPVDSLFGAQKLSREDIVAVSGDSVCRNLAEAYAKLPGEVFTPESVNAIRVGKAHFAIFDPNVMTGETRSIMIFDSDYVLKGSRQARARR